MLDHQLRAHAYSLLGAFLAGPPSRDLLGLLKKIEDQPEMETPMTQAWQMMKAAGGQTEPLDDEYHRLFIGLGRGELIPYGSWYQTGTIMGRPLARLRNDLAALGIQSRFGNCETEDHVAALCETMALLCSHPQETGLEIQKTFFNDHLKEWSGHFFEEVQQRSKTSFYRAVGGLGQAFLDLEMAYFQRA